MSSPSADAEETRAQSLRAWNSAAEGWQRQQQQLRTDAAAVSHKILEGARLQPGHRVLELAAGVGETGFLAAELIAPGGELICSDQSEAMLDAARARADELDVENVEFKVIEAEWIDLPLASLDAVLCRWGYMLMADPDAALRETRRVLRPGGRVALAAWTDPPANPWATVPAAALVARGLVAPPEPGGPGMFALADPDALARRLEDAGFTGVEFEAVDFLWRQPTLERFWETQLDLSPALGPALQRISAADARELRDGVFAELEQYVTGSGDVVLPARSLVAAASA